MTRNSLRTALVCSFALALGVGLVAAQEMPGLGAPTALAQQSLRPYWHVFIAYSIVILLVAGWVGSIAKRLGEVERRLGD